VASTRSAVPARAGGGAGTPYGTSVVCSGSRP
jgi:hypothetical protein